VPVGFVPYILGAFIAWTIFSASALGVGPRLGDDWYVPIQDGYELSIFNAMDWGEINGRSGIRVEYVREVVRAGSWLAGKSNPVFEEDSEEEARYFMLDMSADSLAWYESKHRVPVSSGDIELNWLDSRRSAGQQAVMTRLARVVTEGVPHHVTQRGNRRRPVTPPSNGRRGD